MNSFDTGLLLGLVVLAIDFSLWRFVKVYDARAKLAVRISLFAVLTYVLWDTKQSPFAPSVLTDDIFRHLVTQGLKLIWWFQAAQVSAALVGKVILPAKLHGERLLRDMLRAIIFVAAAVAGIVYVLELPVGGLLATSGAVAIVLGLAVQSTLSDVFSGVILNATRPFDIGDTVSIGDIEGRVMQSDWRATTLISGDGNTVIIPNSTAAKANITNRSRPSDVHGVTLMVHVSSSVRPSLVLSALRDAVASTSGLLPKPESRVNARTLGKKYSEYELLVFVDALSKKKTVQTELVDHAYRHLLAHGIEFNKDYADVRPSASNARLLREIEMFKPLTDEQIESLSESLVRQDFPAGDVIYEVGPDLPDERRALYILSEGVAVMVRPHEGQEVELQRLSPGDSVGRAGILTGISSNIKLRALTPVKTLRLAKESLSPLLRQYPEIAQDMVNQLVRDSARASALVDGLTAESANDGFVSKLLASMRRLHGLVLR